MKWLDKMKGAFGQEKSRPNPAQERKNASIARLKREDIPYIEHLPVIESEEEVQQRSLEEIAKRAIACLLTIQVAFEIQNGDYNDETLTWARETLQRYEAWSSLTPREQAVVDNRASEQDLIDIVWKYEAYWSLVWALGIVETLDYPDHVVDGLAAIAIVRDAGDFQGFISQAKVRPLAEILDEADLLYRYHWACVDARINGRPAPASLQEEVVLERRAGLDWLIGASGAEDWDHVQLHT